MIKRLALIFLATALQALAATYYVTQSGAGSRDGSSTANAWAVSDFNATTKPGAGDSVIFSGNLSTGLSPKANGTSSGQLLLDLKGATVSAPVTINAESYLTLSGATVASSLTTGTAINMSSANNVTFDAWTYKSSDVNGWPSFIYFNGCSNVTFSNCTIQNCGYAFVGDRNTNVLITGCDVLSSQNGTTNVGNQTDLIHFGGGQNITIEKSRLNLRAPGSAKGGSDGSARHNDVIQTYATGGSNGRAPSNWTIRYNWIENSNTTGDGNSSWLMIESQGGYFKIYSNVFVCPANANGINNGVHMGTGQSQSDQYPFYNNTVIKKQNAPGNAISFNDANKPAGQGNGTLFCVNNIAYSGLTGSGQGATASNMKVGKISNNFWYNFSNAPSGCPGIPPGPGGSSTTNPQFADFNNNDFSLAKGSPCIGAGDGSLGSEYNQGIAPGSTWPNPTIAIRSGSWDAGAFVSNAGPAPSPTPTPTPTPPPYPTPTPAAKFSVGDYVSPTQTVNIRATPAGTLLGTHGIDDIGVVKSGPTVADLNGAPVNWYEVTWSSDPVDGWVGDDNLVATTSPSPTPSPTPTPAPTPTPTPTPGPSPTPCPAFTNWNSALHTELSNCPSQTDLDNWLKANPPYPDTTTRKKD